MKLSCDIVQDLLPLYEEDLCSAGSKTAIEKHLAECTECRKLVEGVQMLSDITEPEPTAGEVPECADASEDASRQAAAIAGSLRKIKQRWIKSLVWIAIAMPFCFLVGIMISNQVRQQGTCFTNLDEIMTIYRFANAMEQGDYETAVEFMDYEELYQEIKNLEVPLPTEDVFYKDDWKQYEYLKEQYDIAKAMSLEEFTEVVKQRCLEDMLECKEQNITFENMGYVFSYFLPESGEWMVELCFLVSKDEESCRMTFGFGVNKGKLSLGSSSSVTEVEWYDTVGKALDLYYLY